MLTKLLLSALIIYCFWCYKMILFGCGKCPACRGAVRDPESEQQSEQLRYLCERMPVRMFFIHLFVFIPLVIFVGPVLMPFMAAKLYFEDRKKAAQLRQHSDLTFAWTNPSNLPAHIREYFNQHTPELERLGFECDGVYWMKPQHGHYYGALFLNQSGTTYATLAHMHGDYWCGFGSIFESGRCLETCSVEATPERMARFLENPQFTVVYTSDETIGSNYQKHQRKLAEIFNSTGDRPLTFETSQLCDVLQYESRVHSQQQYKFGDLDTPPPAPALPSGSPISLGSSVAS